VFNIQPGMGLGSTASKQIALGLGSGLIVRIRKTASDGYGRAKDEIIRYKEIIQEDAEMLETIIQSFIAGIFD